MLDWSESDERFRSFGAASPVGIFIADMEGSCTYSNPRCQAICGFSAEQALGRGWFSFVHPEDQDWVLRQWSDDARAGREFSGQFRFQNPAAGTRWTHVRTAPLVGADGEPVGHVGTVEDITERRLADEQLRESEARFRELAENIHEVFYISDLLKPQMLYISPAYEEIWGRSCASLIAAPFSFLEAVHPDDRARVVDALEQQKRGQRTSVEYRIIRPNGELRWIQDRAFPRRDETGRVYRVFGTAEDVSERKLIEQQLREQSEILDTLNQLGAALSAELDLQKLVQALTDAATEVTGAQFGAFFYNIINEQGEAYTLYTLSGVPREAFQSFPMPRNTHIFAPTFKGESAVRSDDVTQDPRYGQNPPYHGMPAGHLPVVSYLAVPVISRSGEVLGGLFFGHPERGVFNERHERIVTGLAAEAAIAMDNARLYEAAQRARQRAELSEQHVRFLSDASKLLASSLDYETTLNRIVDLAVPFLADWSTIDLLQPSGTFRRLRVAHADPARAHVARQLEQYPPRLDSAHPMLQALHERRAVLFSAIDDAWLQNAARSPEHLELLRSQGYRSAIYVPLATRKTVLGVMVFLTAESGRQYDATALKLAEELAGRVAVSLENAQLYRELDQRVIERTAELQAVNQSLESEVAERARAEVALRQQASILQEQAKLLELAHDSIFTRDMRAAITYWNHGAEVMYGWTRAEALGRSSHELLQTRFPIPLPLIDEALQRDSYWEGELQQTTRDNRRLVVNSRWALQRDARGEPTSILEINTDITERKLADALLAAEKNVLELIAHGAARSDVLVALCHNVEQLIPDVYCSVLLIDAEGKHLLHGAAPSLADSYNRAIHGIAIGPNVGSCGRAAYLKQQVIAPDIFTDPNWEPFRELARAHNLRSCWSTPFLSKAGKVLGTFALYYSEPRKPNTRELSIMERAAHLAAIAIERIHDEEQLRQSAQQMRALSGHLQSAREEERLRIARELHDGLGQALTALKMDVRSLSRRLARADGQLANGEVAHELDSMSHFLDETIRMMREILVQLRPEMLEDLGLKAAMEWQVDEFQTRTGIACSFQCSLDSIELDRDRSMAVFRILQESLTNVARHAQASRVDVCVRHEDEQLRLEVRDNGRGIAEREKTKAKSFGIIGMRERALLLGGQIQIEAAPGKGTLVSLHVPLATPQTQTTEGGR